MIHPIGGKAAQLPPRLVLIRIEKQRSSKGMLPKGQGEQKGLILSGCLRSLSQAVSGGSKEICREMVRTVIGISVRRIAATVASDCAL